MTPSDKPEAPDARPSDAREAEIRAMFSGAVSYDAGAWLNATGDSLRLLDTERATVATLRKQTETTYCAYCGHATQIADKDEAARQITEHIRSCPEHPMRALEADNARLRASQARLLEALRWYIDNDDDGGTARAAIAAESAPPADESAQPTADIARIMAGASAQVEKADKIVRDTRDLARRLAEALASAHSFEHERVGECLACTLLAEARRAGLLRDTAGEG